MLKNRFLVFLFLFMLGSVLTMGDSTYAATKMPGKAISITSTIKERDFTGYVINGRTYVDVRGILNCLPFLVNSKAISFDAQTKTLKIYSNDFVDNPTPLYQFLVGKKSFVANDVVVDMDSVILISSSRIYIPLKDFVRYQNFKITYNQLTHTVLVSK